MDDGKIVLRVVRIEADTLHCTVEKGGGLRERQGVNFPGTATRLPALTDKDRADAAAALAAGTDYLALSFVRQAADVAELRRLVDRAGTGTGIVAKIEKPQAIENLDGILGVTDAVMVARGDLGVEVDIERIGVLQKQIIGRCRRAHIPVIVATQMLESMMEQPRPTRAEATDVTNAILDGTDAVMLSGETSLGRYPMETVRTMATIAAETEKYLRQMPHLLADDEPLERVEEPLTAIARAAYRASVEVGAAAVTVHTMSGRTARVLSRFRPDCPIAALTPDPAAWRRMTLYYGVHPCRIRASRSSDHLMEQAESWVRSRFPLDKPTHFVILSGQARTVGATNTMRIATIRPPRREHPAEAARD
jgi:pyruvate kinase